MDNDQEKDYEHLPNDPLKKNPSEEGDVLHQNDDTTTPVGHAQDVNIPPDSPLADRNAEEANEALQEKS